MIIRIIEHEHIYSVKTQPHNSDSGKHTEKHLVTTVWFLFIPIFIKKRLKQTTS